MSATSAPPAPADLVADLDAIAADVRRGFEIGRRVLSFEEYLALYASDPARYGRDASRYVRDLFQHYGTSTVDRPYGQSTRYALFDLPFADAGAQRERLIGQEEVQGELFRIFSNFAREGRPTKLTLLHGPNGSSKSTIAACLMRALEHYSTLDEGALYRFHWVFPSAKTIKSRIGFGGDRGAASASDSFAHLDEDLIDAKLHNEVRDHPLFLLAPAARRALVERAHAASGVTEPPPDWLARGRLSHKSQQVYEALLSHYRGELRQVLRHVSVERYFVSRRYRVGAVTLGPQMSVDAGERQITADRSLAALPASLQAITMFEAFGELIDASGGVLEFSDLLKRPLDAYKYLQLSVETGEVALQHQTVQLNAVLFGSANEVHLAALRDHPEWASFRGRLELLRTGYLRTWTDEQRIYDEQVAPQVRKHVAPHATFVAALFAVLTRMRKPRVDRFSADLAAMVGSLSALEKAELYAQGTCPERLEPEQAKLLRAAIRDLWGEGGADAVYEGRLGASPREVKGALLDAAQDARFSCLSPLAVLDELAQLSTRTAEYEWLQQEPQPGGYHDPKALLEQCRGRLLDRWEDELRVASGLVDERSWLGVFDRYVKQVSVWTKGEKVKNALTGAYEGPDEALMKDVEARLGTKGDAGEFRRGILGAVAAWSIDHPGAVVDHAAAFPQHLRRLKASTYAERGKAVADVCRLLVSLVEGEGRGLEPSQLRVARGALERLEGAGYCRACARDAASAWLRWRLA